MSTTYYHKTNCCDKCGRCDLQRIGARRAAGGGKTIFVFDNKLLPLTTIASKGQLVDEYGTKLTLDELLDIIAKCDSNNLNR